MIDSNITHNLFILANNNINGRRCLDFKYDVDKYIHSLDAAKVNFYIRSFELDIVDENNSLALVRELLDSNDEDNILIAATIVSNLKLRE